MKDKNYFIDETAFQEKERLKNRFGKTYFINVTDKDKEAKVFVFELGEFFITEKFPLKSSDQTINGKEYIPIYVENYIKGQEYFLSNYHVKSDTLFRDSNPYIQILHNCFFHAEPISGKNGWEYYETTFPIVISKKVVADYGFFAGILFEFKQLQKKYSTLFKDFEKNCPLELPANNHKKHSETKNGKLQAPDIALFCRIVEHSKTMKRGYDEKYQKFCMKVCQKFSLPYTDRVRQNFKDAEPELKETDKKFIKIEEHILPNLPIEAKRKIDQYIKGKIKLYG
jgi:hypothetical protein